jgi:hypothetical protein
MHAAAHPSMAHNWRRRRFEGGGGEGGGGGGWGGKGSGRMGNAMTGDAHSFLLRAVRPPLDFERAVVKALREVDGRDMELGREWWEMWRWRGISGKKSGLLGRVEWRCEGDVGVRGMCWFILECRWLLNDGG